MTYFICEIKESGLKQPCQSGTLTSCEAYSTGTGRVKPPGIKKGRHIAMKRNSAASVISRKAAERETEKISEISEKIVRGYAEIRNLRETNN